MVRHHGDARVEVRKISLENAPIPTRIRVADDLEITIRVPHRDTLAPVDLALTVPLDLPMPRDMFLHFVVETVARFWAHEALEWAHVDGRRYVDPHPGGSVLLPPIEVPHP